MRSLHLGDGAPTARPRSVGVLRVELPALDPALHTPVGAGLSLYFEYFGPYSLG